MKRPRRSLLWKLFGSVLGCVALLLVGNLLLNSFVLPVYYRHEKEQALKTAFTRLEALYSAGDGEGLSAHLATLGNAQGISVTIWSGPMVVYTDRPDGMRDLLRPDDVRELSAGEYTVQVSDDGRTGQMIRLTGRLSNSYTVSMRVAVAAMAESAAISNRFLLYSGAVTLLLGAAAVALLARGFTRPIRRLSEQAAAVAQLDFSHRYTLKGSDELHALGTSLNEMSDALESTIARLQEDARREQRQNAARRAFIVNVSHELKTPIALLQTYAEGLREDVAADAAERAYYCEIIEDEARKMSGLIAKMTALMQLEDGSEQLEPERFDLCELARNLLTKNAPECARRGLTVQAPPADPVWVTADAYLIENALTNYLSNALHHVPDGGTVAITFSAGEEGRVRISVYNSGSTVPPEDLSRIWESFYKVDKARTRAYGGSGIGLSLVAAIMNAHGCPYGVIDRIDPVGVEFYFELPRAE